MKGPIILTRHSSSLLHTGTDRCCYPANHSNVTCNQNVEDRYLEAMNRETYGPVYEISARTTGDAEMTPEVAVNQWIASRYDLAKITGDTAVSNGKIVDWSTEDHFGCFIYEQFANCYFQHPDLEFNHEAKTDCVDRSKECKQQKEDGVCTDNVAWATKNCKKSCSLCSNPTGGEVSDCEDERGSVQCNKWAANGDCTSNHLKLGSTSFETKKLFMKKNCKKACSKFYSSYCPKTACKDDDPKSCAGGLKITANGCNLEEFKKKCKKSCGLCSTTPETVSDSKPQTPDPVVEYPVTKAPAKPVGSATKDPAKPVGNSLEKDPVEKEPAVEVTTSNPAVVPAKQTAVCGQGYYYKKGDVDGSDVIGDSNNWLMANVPNTGACADKCNMNNQCNAYEYSPSQKKCFLVKVQKPTSSGAYETYNFCSKQKACQDDDPKQCSNVIALVSVSDACKSAKFEKKCKQTCSKCKGTAVKPQTPNPVVGDPVTKPPAKLVGQPTKEPSIPVGPKIKETPVQAATSGK